MKPKIVAIDGPAGSGKSSICSEVCTRIGWTYVNTGAIYRALGVLARLREISLSDENAMCQLATAFAREAVWDPAGMRLHFQGEDLTNRLGSAQAALDASHVARQPLLREKLLPLQRRLADEAPVGALVDGRDIGTVVFPDADLKIFMTASLEERARRRLVQLQGDGKTSADGETTLEKIQSEIARRDMQDSERATAPMKIAPNAVVFDTSKLTAEETKGALQELLRSHGLL